ncbi:MAG: hypothetical protein A2V64_11570 [Bacteroidetes bacterium RBG_13_43_22]|nr:MAG: hypothetical protein A2V64_11570 [Bacteroidetes bacterium RBG_13_43_22]
MQRTALKEPDLNKSRCQSGSMTTEKGAALKEPYMNNPRCNRVSVTTQAGPALKELNKTAV